MSNVEFWREIGEFPHRRAKRGSVAARKKQIGQGKSFRSAPLARKERIDGIAIVRHRRDRVTTAKPALLQLPLAHQKSDTRIGIAFLVVGRGRFELPKSVTSDLQSDPFGRSGIFPYMQFNRGGFSFNGAGDWNRTHNLLITNQLLCQLSYTSTVGASGRNRTTDTGIFSPLLYRLSYRGI